MSLKNNNKLDGPEESIDNYINYHIKIEEQAQKRMKERLST
jgi:hypothetical protein